jgi:hypothetical protein
MMAMMMLMGFYDGLFFIYEFYTQRNHNADRIDRRTDEEALILQTSDNK